MDLQEAQHSNYKLVLCVQTSCCRWDSLRRRSRTRWWTRSTMMWWLHICYWTIGTLRYPDSFSYLHAFILSCQLLLVSQSSLSYSYTDIIHSLVKPALVRSSLYTRKCRASLLFCLQAIGAHNLLSALNLNVYIYAPNTQKKSIFSPLCLLEPHYSLSASPPDIHIFVLFLPPQLDEGCIKPRPGSDVSNINAPSPPHKVQWEHIMSSANK